MNQEQLNQILDDHRQWLNTFNQNGRRAVLSDAVLSDADLCRANLRDANLRGAVLSDAVLRDANLRDANLRGADLSDAVLSDAVLSDADLSDADLCRADLSDADLRGADLSDADLCRANLRDADLCRANLRDADLRGAVLRGANLRGANLPAFGIPDEGDLIVWKRVAKGVAKITVPDGAKRTGSPTGRKCRAEYVETLAIYDAVGNEINESPGQRDTGTVYRVGEITRPDKYDDDFRVECSHGIHFFLTRAEAEAW